MFEPREMFETPSCVIVDENLDGMITVTIVMIDVTITETDAGTTVLGTTTGEGIGIATMVVESTLLRLTSHDSSSDGSASEWASDYGSESGSDYMDVGVK